MARAVPQRKHFVTLPTSSRKTTDKLLGSVPISRRFGLPGQRHRHYQCCAMSYAVVCRRRCACLCSATFCLLPSALSYGDAASVPLPPSPFTPATLPTEAPPPPVDSLDRVIPERIRNLRREIAFHDRLYFEEDAPVISDFAYDQLKRELRELEATFPMFKADISMLSEHLEPTTSAHLHRIPMLSLDKAYSIDDWARFHQRTAAALTPDKPHYLIEPKYDGVAVSLIYRDGLLVAAATRGNGIMGEQILEHVQTIKNLPRLLEFKTTSSASEEPPHEIEIRGEIYIALSDYAQLNAERFLAGEQPYQSPRSVAAGALRRIDRETVENRSLSIVVFGVGACDPPSYLPPSQQAIYQQFANWSLPVIPHYWTADSSEEVWATIQTLATERADWDFPHDGLVVKVDSLQQQAVLGTDKTAPRWAIACKFAPARTATVLQAVEPQVGRTGIITPVAVFDPVSLAGATIRRASLHNYQQVAALDLHIGDTVFIERAGEVVPQIAQVDKSRRLPHANVIVPPPSCPACGTPVEQDGAYIRCPLRACPAQLRKRIEHFAGRDALNITALTPGVIEMLLSNGFIKDFPDLFKLTAEDIPQLAAIGIADPEQLFRAIGDRKNAPASRYFVGIGIPGIGRATARQLAASGIGLKELITFRQDDFENLGLHPSTAQSIESHFQNLEAREAIHTLITAGVHPEVEGSSVSPAFKGFVFAFSGTLESLTRQEAIALIEAYGGTVGSSVSRSTTHLVCGENPGQKLVLARERGIAVLSEEAFRDMLLSVPALPVR